MPRPELEALPVHHAKHKWPFFPSLATSNLVTIIVQLCGIGDLHTSTAGMDKTSSHIPPKPVANPTVPSLASISTKIEPRTLMPQLVRELRYFSHPDMGVAIGDSMSLNKH